jgi:hypothetical protein
MVHTVSRINGTSFRRALFCLSQLFFIHKNNNTMAHFTICRKVLIPVGALTVLLTACATISTFDQYAYTQTTSLKVDALSVMGHAADDYTLHQDEVKNMATSLSKIVEYEKNRPKNTVAQKMWGILTDTTGNLYGGFVKRWQREGKLDTAFIRASQDLVGQSFDQISQLESGKVKPAKIN